MSTNFGILEQKVTSFSYNRAIENLDILSQEVDNLMP